MAKKKKEEILDKEEKKTRKKRKKPLENEETLSSSLESPKRTPCIYKAYNHIENKYYIGQSIEGITKRKNKHIRKAFSKNPESRNKWQKAIVQYYRFIEWSVEEYIDITNKSLEEVQNELNNKEIFYIKKYDSFVNGYNSTPGGGNCINHKRRTHEEKLARRRLWKKNYYNIHPEKAQERRERQYASIERRRDQINKQRNARRASNREAVNAKLRLHRELRETKFPEKRIIRLEKHKAYLKMRRSLNKRIK